MGLILRLGGVYETRGDSAISTCASNNLNFWMQHLSQACSVKGGMQGEEAASDRPVLSVGVTQVAEEIWRLT